MAKGSGSGAASVSALVFVACIPLFLVTASVAWAFNDPGLYHRGFEKYKVSAASGISEEDLREVGAAFRAYFNSRQETLAIQTRVYGEKRELFNEREVHHMRDVKRLVWGVYVIAAITGVYLAITTVRWLRSGHWGHRRLLARCAVWGGCVTVGAIVLFGLFTLSGFEAVFTLFHRISFTNDLWQLDPRRDYLVILFPLGFWFDATVSVALSAVAGALALIAAGLAWQIFERSRRDGVIAATVLVIVASCVVILLAADSFNISGQRRTGPAESTAVTPRPISSANAKIASGPLPTKPVFDLPHREERAYMLGLINDARLDAGIPPVTFGGNRAAQLHAESLLEHCVASHWSMDGLKPYMRYSLAGGYQSNAENVSGLDYCYSRSDWVEPLSSFEAEAREEIRGFLASPGHRENILDPWHKRVNIGLAWDSYNLRVVQHFEGNYVEYDRLPQIKNAVLSLAGHTKNGARFLSDDEFGVQIYFDRPPMPLTRGQVSRTYCYAGGVLVSSLRPPAAVLSYWTEDEYLHSYRPCPDPYDVSGDIPGPQSDKEADSLWRRAYEASKTARETSLRVPWITASEWNAAGERFEVTADLNEVLGTHGNGVYTVVLWDTIKGEDVVISEYSMFHGVSPPRTYNP